MTDPLKTTRWAATPGRVRAMLDRLRRRGRAPAPTAANAAAAGWPLDHPLFHLSPKDPFTIGHAVENVLVVGGIGSGKTSGSGFQLAMSYLISGAGILVLCAKPDEPQLWRRYCELAGRLDDLVEFKPGGPWRFDPLAFELASGAGARNVENLVQMFMALLDLGDRDGGKGGKEGGEQYWRKALLQLLRNLVDLIVLATGTLSVPDLYRVAVSTATSPEEVKSEAWRARSLCFKYLTEADRRPKTQSQRRDFELVADYFLTELPALSEKTRSVILSTFTSMADSLCRGMLRDLFTEGTNVDPTDLERGKIIVVDLPLKTYGQLGLLAAGMWKFATQKSIERRDVRASPRPVALWQDEGQFFLLPGQDFLFTSTARSARVSNVLLTQSISGVLAVLGGPAGKAEADAFLSNFATKVFHANTDPTSNEYAANLIGRCRQFVVNSSNNYQGGSAWAGSSPDQRSGGSAGVSEVFEYELMPQAFTALKTGGRANRGVVEAIVFRNGSAFRGSGRNHMRATFHQGLQG